MKLVKNVICMGANFVKLNPLVMNVMKHIIIKFQFVSNVKILIVVAVLKMKIYVKPVNRVII